MVFILCCCRIEKWSCHKSTLGAFRVLQMHCKCRMKLISDFSSWHSETLGTILLKVVIKLHQRNFVSLVCLKMFHAYITAENVLLQSKFNGVAQFFVLILGCQNRSCYNTCGTQYKPWYYSSPHTEQVFSVILSLRTE